MEIHNSSEKLPSQRRLVRWLGIILLLGMVLFQLYIAFSNYGLLFLKRAARTYSLGAMERSALILLGNRAADFLIFLDETVPIDQSVVIPEGAGPFGSQNVLQFFLMPRMIPGCRCPSGDAEYSEACISCLRESDHYIPAVNKFPNPQVLEGIKEFVPFGTDEAWYRGVYVPIGDPQVNENPTIRSMEYLPVGVAALIDLILFLSVLLIGFSYSCYILPGNSKIWALALAYPLGSGLMTLVVFLLSWAGFRVTSGLFVFSFVLLVIPIGYMYLRHRNRTVPNASFLQMLKSGMKDDRSSRWIQLTGIVLLVMILASALIIGVSRGYSRYDSIANWGLKGYAIAQEGSVFAGSRWGAHVLEYPQNLHIQIALFRVFDHDTLPGSKIIFWMYFTSLLIGVYLFFLKIRVHSTIAVLGTLTLATVPFIFFHATIGYANLPMSTYLVLGVLILIIGLVEENGRWQLLGSTILAMAAWTRVEPLAYVVVLLAVLIIYTVIFRKKPIQVWACILPPILILTPWVIFYQLYGATGSDATRSIRLFFESLFLGREAIARKFSLLVRHIQIQLADESRWGAIVPLTIVALIAILIGRFRKVDVWIRYLLIAFLTTLVLILMISTLHGLVDESMFIGWLGESLDRHSIPVFILLAILSVVAIDRALASEETVSNISENNEAAISLQV